MVGSKASHAKVFFDTDVYGDKELKIATVNKMKQKLRNAILLDYSIAPLLLELSINDALGYDPVTTDGGPDGSVAFEVDREGNKKFSGVIDILSGVKKDLQRTNTVSFADLVSFGGGEALETVGCPRTIVQVGRFDAKKANIKASLIDWDNLQPTEAALDAFYLSGVEPKDIALLLGALGETIRISSEALAAARGRTSSEDENEEEDDQWQNSVPSTFGERSQIYGKKMGKADFGTTYLSSISGKRGPAESDALGKLLLLDPKVKIFVLKYATNPVAFLKEVPEAYLRLSLLGEAYTTRNS